MILVLKFSTLTVNNNIFASFWWYNCCQLNQIPDIFPVLAAAHKTLVAKSRDTLTTRTLHSELVYNYSGSKHVIMYCYLICYDSYFQLDLLTLACLVTRLLNLWKDVAYLTAQLISLLLDLMLVLMRWVNSTVKYSTHLFLSLT